MPNMNAVAASELTAMRTEVAAAVCDTPVTIQRGSGVRDAWAQESDTYSTVGTAMAGIAPPSAAQLQSYADVIGSQASWIVQFPYGTDVRRLDHVVIGSDTLILQVDLSPQSYNILTSFLALEIKE